MSKIVIQVENDEIRDKVLWFLENLNGVEINKNNFESDKFDIKNDWKKIALSTKSSDIKDDEMLEKAVWESYSEKYTY